MDLREGSRSVSGKAKGRAESAPVRRREDVGVFNENAGLTMARDARIEQRVQVVDFGQVRRDNRVGIKAELILKSELRAGLMHLVHSVGPEIVERDDAYHHGSECGRDLWIADIRNVLLAFDHKMM